MPSVYEFMENPQIFVYETTLIQNPDILHCLIDYISINPNPMVMNEQECYLYPSKAAQILSMHTTYRVLISKRERKNKKTNEDEFYYPHLDRLFKNLRNNENIEESLLGYLNKVLVSLAKKTPEIYEYFKQNQELMNELIKNNQYLLHLQEFWMTFLIESTMNLYIFLKNVFVRALMFRIVDDKDDNNIQVYQTLTYIYDEFSKKLQSKFLPQDQIEELEEIAHNFTDQDFITLLILKISPLRSQKSFFIGRLILTVLKNCKNKEEIGMAIAKNHIETMQDYFEAYEECSGFMDNLLKDQIQILKILLLLAELKVLELQHQANLLKRLLVYSSIHKKKSVLHILLVKMINLELQKKNEQIFRQINVIPFLMKNSTYTYGMKYSYGTLIWQICEICQTHYEVLEHILNEEQKSFIKQIIKQKSSKLEGLTMYKSIPSLPSHQEESLEASQQSANKQEEEKTQSPQKNIQNQENVDQLISQKQEEQGNA